MISFIAGGGIVFVMAIFFFDTLLETTWREPVELQLNNPIFLSVEAEIKCDYNKEKKGYDYYRKVKLPGNKSTTIKFPRNVNKCEVWPKVF